MATPTADTDPDPDPEPEPVIEVTDGYVDTMLETDNPDEELHLADGNPPPEEPSPYAFDPADIDLAAELLELAYSQHHDDFSRIHAIVEAAGARGLDHRRPLVRELEAVASYHLLCLERGNAGAELTSIAFERPAWPPEPRAVEADVVELWTALAGLVTHPAAVARLNDLLFEGHHGSRRDTAQRAAEAYVQVGSERPVDYEQLHALARAWHLARSVKLAAIDEEARRQMAELAEAALEFADDLPSGMLLPPLEILAQGPLAKTSPDPIATDEILAAFAQAVCDGEDATTIAQLRRARTKDRDERERIIDDEVDGYFRHAGTRADDGLARMFFLETASRRAKALGRPAKARDAAAELQRLAPKVPYQRFRQEFSLPRYIPEAFLAGFTRSSDWRDGLRYFFSTKPPTGSLEAIDEQAARPRGLLDLVQNVVVGSHGMPRSTTDGEDDALASRRHDIARLYAGHEGLQLSIGLDRMKTRYGAPTEDGIVAVVLEGGASDPLLARSFAKALRHYWAGDYESSVHLVAPKIEAAMRNLLCELDEGIYRVEIGDKAGGYPGVHNLLKELEEIALDESWAYFLRWLFLGPHGANLRNEVAHGYVPDISPPMAALALRAFAMLVVVAGPPTYDRLGDEIGDPPADEPKPRTRAEITDLLRAPLGPADAVDQVLSLVAKHLERALWSVETLRLRRRIRK